MLIVVLQFEEQTQKQYTKDKGYYQKTTIYFHEYIENTEYLPPKKFSWDMLGTKILLCLTSLFLNFKRNLED